MTDFEVVVNSLCTSTQPTSTPLKQHTTKRKKTKRCKSPQEQKAARMLREFKRAARQRGACCEVCWRSKTLGSMHIVSVLWVHGRPVGAYAVCRRCRSKYARTEMSEFKRLVELALTVDWLEVWG